jgi:phosphodiesterase/alkaline phosphatase D-like protein
MRRFAVPALTIIALAATLALVTGATFGAGAPSATTGAASAIADTSTTVAGTVNPQGQSTGYEFQYGTTTAYGQHSDAASAGAGSADVPVTAPLSGLTPGTTYHFRVIATNDGGTTVGADQTFTTTGTAPPPSPKATVTTGSATPSTSGATLTGSLNPNGVATSYYFELGTTSNYGQQTPPGAAGSGTQTVAVSAVVNGLKAKTTYHYRLVAVGPGGASLGADATFSTSGSSSTRLSFFGKTSFADQHGVGGVFLGCFGTVGCGGKSVTFTRSGQTLAERDGFTIGANDGGFVHVTLNTLGQSLLRHRGAMNVNTTVVNANGQKVTGVLKLIRYPKAGLKG